MDKKNNIRLNQNSAKGSLTERKGQDVSIGKQWPRNSRRRDPKSTAQSSSDSPRNNNHKPQPKNNFDKRASNGRGNGYQRSAGSSALTPSTRLDADDPIEAELNSVYLPGSKKQNLNHLLNFNYTPRETASNSVFQRTGYHRQPGRRIKYNKEQFLQANCQFIIRSDIDKSALLPHSISPDHLIDWSFVEQVNVQSSEEPQCPICLFHPVAGKMTRCGHIYCWPCVLHYLALSDKTWRKCPICYEAIHAADLKSSTSKPYRNFKVGDFVSMQLMCREKCSLKVNKVGKVKPDGFPHISGDADEILHSKLVLADPKEIMGIIERERNELNFQLETDGPECPESIFVQQALELLKEREANTVAMMKIVIQKEPAIADDIHTKLEKLSVDADPFVPITANCKSTQETIVEPADKLVDSTTEDEANMIVQDLDITPVFNDSNYFYFYQSRDGQPLYLHSINVRMLQMMYGSLDRAPHVIGGKIVQKEVCSMTEELRKRLKYLQHLPVTSQFEVAELSLGSELVSEEVLGVFKDEIVKRQKLRQRRARDENRREVKINEVNERQIGKILSRSANIDVNSDRQFPSCGGNPPLFNDRDDPPLQLLSSSSDLSVSPSTSGTSFAKMLSQPKKIELWPSLNPTPSPSWNSAGPSDGAIRKQTISTRSSYNASDDNIDDDDDMAAPPEFRSDFGTAIAVALEKQMFQSGDGKTKKKKRNTVLFSTGLPGRSFKGN
ncbi:RING finger protein 10 [Bradysia coprophila]|uniref:RING finger protein 10 n=1 Tax=Bradysia coprophila TaxID=38358 RepID=UPI00187DCC62|nr:RING finger protein 10 [Bradysia coprophila]